jgi:1,4-dihydroxy-2-naphthoate polyprenyltransferase
MNVSMWAKALQVIPRISKNEWLKLDVISKWLIATRSAVLIITFIPAVLAGILAFRDGQFNFGLWAVMTIGLIFAHATNNMVNDMTDYRRGVDKDNYFRAQYGPQPLEHGLMTMRQVLAYVAVTGLVALICGLVLAYARGSVVVALLAIGVFFVLFYTWPLKYIGLGELAVILVWGPLMVGGGYYAVTGAWSWNVVIASLPYALGATTVIFGKHVDKYLDDKAKGIHTLPVLIGERNGRYTVLAMMGLQYLITLYLILTGYFSPILLVVLFGLTALPQVVPMYLQPKPKEEPKGYPPEIWPLYFVAAAFLHNKRFGLWYLLGILVDAILRVAGVLH